MCQIGLEAVLCLETAGEWRQHAHRDLVLGAAGAADEVTVPVLAGKMPAGQPVLEVGVRDVAEALERLEVPVHGRRIYLRMLLADTRGDVLCGRVMTRALERVEYETALHCHALALRAYAVGDVHQVQLSRDSERCARRRYCVRSR